MNPTTSSPLDETLRKAFQLACDGYSPDRVVVDPEMNARFLSECASLSLTQPPTHLNRALLNLRKRGALRGLRSARTSFSDEDDYRFAAEMAARHLERREGQSLDRIMCDPSLVAEFDALAVAIAPGFSVLQYRWAALNLRKARRMQPELLVQVVPPTAVHVFRIQDLVASELPSKQGLYFFYTPSHPLYIGETHSLRNRLEKHLDHSDNKALARWIWEFGMSELFLEVQVFADDVSQRVRKALEAEMIRSRKPLFNVKVLEQSRRRDE